MKERDMKFFLPRKVRANPRKTHGPSPIFQPNWKEAKKSMGIPRRAIIKSETLGKEKGYKKGKINDMFYTCVLVKP